MTIKDFVGAYYADAKKTQNATGISWIAILAQAALESGWGKACPGNCFFGIKDSDGINGNEQLLTTTEYSRRADLKFPVIISITPIVRNGQKWFRYRIKDYFRKYDTPAECFTDHAHFFFKYKRYNNALKVMADPYKFIDAISEAGYATDPDYAKKLKLIAKLIEQNYKTQFETEPQ
jgi:flagellar protein FlgJ